MTAFRHLLQLAYWAGFWNASKVIFGLLRMHSRYFLLGRGRGLIKLLPMKTPMKVHVDPASGCNFRCFFCPQANPKGLKDAGVQMGNMSMEDFKKLVDGFDEFPNKVDEFVLGNYGEPTLNPLIGEMLIYAKASKSIREVTLITNGSLLKGERLEKIASSGVDKIRISIEAMSDETYATTTDTRQTFTGIVENVRNLKAALKKYKKKTFVYTKIIDTNLSPDEKRKFFKTFIPISHASSIESLVAVTEKARDMIGENQKGMTTGTKIEKSRKVCPSPFYSLSIHSNGDVGVCCTDWHHKTKVGSIRTESVKEIWEGRSLKSFRLDQLVKSWKGVDACKGCELVQHYPKYEDLDDHAETLIQALK